MDEALWTYLMGSSALTAACNGQIFWGLAPQGTVAPYLSMHIIGGAEGLHLTGRDGLWRGRVQMDCYGADRPAALAMSRALVAVLDGHHDTGLAGFRGVFLETTREGTEDAAEGRPCRISHDFMISWRGSNA